MKSGVYRNVFKLGRYAVKLARPNHFFEGLRCNRWEKEIWKKWRRKFLWNNLCPVLFSDWFGFVLVMPWANQPVLFGDVLNSLEDSYPSVPFEIKPENFGELNNKILVLDYGLHSKKLVHNQRKYYLGKLK